jgi:DNA-binding MarR family transcriptional regulator
VITFSNSAYFIPDKALRKLSLLLAIHEKPRLSQHAIGQLTHLSSSMVNNYIKLFKREGLLTVQGNTNRTQSYHLTEEGRITLRHSLLSYSAEIVQMYGAVKRELSNILHGFYREGIRTVVLFGAAETAEIVHAALKDTDLVMIGVVDSDPSKHGRPFNGLMIQPPEKLAEILPDAIVITSFGKQEEIFSAVRKVVGDRVAIKKLSDI